MGRILVVSLLLLAPALSGCMVVRATGSVISATGSLVSATASATASAIDAVAGGGDDKKRAACEEQNDAEGCTEPASSK